MTDWTAQAESELEDIEATYEFDKIPLLIVGRDRRGTHDVYYIRQKQPLAFQLCLLFLFICILFWFCMGMVIIIHLMSG
jgi:hypothetical protein